MTQTFIQTYKILGAFKTSPIIPLELESALIPPDLRLDTSLLNYVYRTELLSTDHPVKRRLEGINLDDLKGGPYTQLERIKKTITSIAPTELERVEPFKYKPQDSLPYTVKTSKLDKVNEAARYVKLHLDPPLNLVTSYSNASANPKGKGVGVGAIYNGLDPQGALDNPTAKYIREAYEAQVERG